MLNDATRRASGTTAQEAVEQADRSAVSVLLLHFPDLASGDDLTSGLAYLPHEDGFAIFAGGDDASPEPAWFWALQVAPETLVEIGEAAVPVSARIAVGSERARLVDELRLHAPTLVADAEAGERPLPVMVLERC